MQIFVQLNGRPGCGKSQLTAKLVRFLKQEAEGSDLTIVSTNDGSELDMMPEPGEELEWYGKL